MSCKCRDTDTRRCRWEFSTPDSWTTNLKRELRDERSATRTAAIAEQLITPGQLEALDAAAYEVTHQAADDADWIAFLDDDVDDDAWYGSERDEDAMFDVLADVGITTYADLSDALDRSEPSEASEVAWAAAGYGAGIFSTGDAGNWGFSVTTRP